MDKIVITAFGAFGGSDRNSSLETLRALPSHIGGYELVRLPLPVIYGECGRILCEHLDRCQANGDRIVAVVCLGQAEGRGSITPEYVAVNVRHAGAADNAWVKYTLTPIGGGADAYITTLPIGRMLERMHEEGVAANVSFTAGAYVCNDLMYAAMEYCKPRGIAAGFIHLPLSSEIAEAEGKTGRVATLPAAALVRGVAAALSAIAEG